MKPNSSSRFDTLIFDLGKVVIDFDWMRAMKKLEGRTPLSVPEIAGRLKNTDLVHRYESGSLASESFVEEMQKLLELRVSFEEFVEAWSDIFQSDLILETDFIDRLKKHHRLLLLSNTDPFHAAFLKERFPVLEKFDARVFSFEVGAMKPDLKIYEAASHAAQAPADRILYVDDIAAYAEAGASLGWTTVTFKGKEDLLQEFRRLGVAWS
ncbi:MAG: HAD-IA family hydrolase [Acidobacteriia bacterium]|nr:HAD-IA family hydrolase [Terriglobia bacterium]